MKQLFYSLAFVGMLVACTDKKNTAESHDSLQVVKVDSVAKNNPNTEMLYLEDILQCVDLKGLENKYGVANVQKNAVIETLEGDVKATRIFPNTEKEVEIYWRDGQDYKKIQEVFIKSKLVGNDKMNFNTPWVSKQGLKLGMPLSDVVKLNGKNFTISGIGWDLGGNVVSWEGGKMADKNVLVRFSDYSDKSGQFTEQEYSSISGEREFNTQHPVITKLNPTVDQLSVFLKPEIDAELGQKLTKEVEKKQIPR
jgi:hypothetical protein